MFKKLSAILLVFALLASFAACKRFEGNELIIEEKPVVTDESGNTQELQTRVDENGKTEYFYTDDNGNEIVVDKNKVEIETSLVPVQTTLSDKEIEEIFESNDFEKLQDALTENITEPELEMNNGVIPEESFEEVEVEVGSDGKPVHGNAVQKYSDILKSGTFTISLTIQTTTEGVTTVMPITVMKDGNNMFTEMTYPISATGKMRINLIINDTGMYTVLPVINAYYQFPSEEVGNIGDALGDFDLSQMQGDLEMNDNYVSSGKVSLNGKEYDCDIYEAEDGITTKYYFLNDELKRIESTTGNDGYIIEFKEVSGKVNKSKFKLPYGCRNLENFAAAFDNMNFNF